MKSKNIVNIIYPYRNSFRTWVFDDEDTGLVAEPFVLGSSEVIDLIVGEETNKFTLTFSKEILPGFDAKLVKQEELGEGWYNLEDSELINWLCPATLFYFEDYPDNIYIKISNKS